MADSDGCSLATSTRANVPVIIIVNIYLLFSSSKTCILDEPKSTHNACFYGFLLQAAHHNRNGQYQSAQTCGKLAQSSSICMIVIITLLIIGWITLTILGLLLSAWNGF